MVGGSLRTVLRLEGLAYFAAALMIYMMLRGSWLTFVILFLVPDVAFLAYLQVRELGRLPTTLFIPPLVPSRWHFWERRSPCLISGLFLPSGLRMSGLTACLVMA